MFIKYMVSGRRECMAAGFEANGWRRNISVCRRNRSRLPAGVLIIRHSGGVYIVTCRVFISGIRRWWS